MPARSALKTGWLLATALALFWTVSANANDRELAACRERAAGDPSELQLCDRKAIEAAYARVPRAMRHTEELDALLAAMFEPLVQEAAGGTDALAQRVTVSAAYVTFAQQRSAILNGRAPKPVPHGALPFARLKREGALADLDRRWARIRKADCTAYPVSDCEAKLDSALRALIAPAKP